MVADEPLSVTESLKPFCCIVLSSGVIISSLRPSLVRVCCPGWLNWGYMERSIVTHEGQGPPVVLEVACPQVLETTYSSQTSKPRRNGRPTHMFWNTDAPRPRHQRNKLHCHA